MVHLKQLCVPGQQQPDILDDERPLIAIAGCGMSGVALAVALQQRGMRAVIYEKDLNFNSRSQGYGLTMQQVKLRYFRVPSAFLLCAQGVTALKHLAVDISGDSISSSVHYSFNSRGQVIGCYGHAQGPSSLGQSAESARGDDTAHQHKNKRQHKIIGRQRLRQLMLDKLLPHTVTAARFAQTFAGVLACTHRCLR
jgi:2-polyprenyl-6-methoxyphenol hydroxylase-like FAD-dependent oxidoreductase